MKQIIFLSFLFLLLAFSCGRINTIDLRPGVKFSLPSNTDKGIKIIQSSDLFFQIPSELFIQDNELYIVDKFNNRVLKYNTHAELLFTINDKSSNDLGLNFAGSNRILQPLTINDKLFDFNLLGKIWVTGQAVYVENILAQKDEEHLTDSYSVILKYTKDGKPDKVIGIKTAKPGQILPFFECEDFSLDKDENIFVFSKNDQVWNVLKLDLDGQVIFNFNTQSFLTNKAVIKKEQESILVDEIDNSYDGSFIILALSRYKNEIEFKQTDFYVIDVASSRFKKLFSINNEEYNFLCLDELNYLYFWETKESKRDIEDVNIIQYNLKGKETTCYDIEFNRSREQWFNFRIQKDRTLTSINIKDNKFNIALWK